MPHRGRAAWVRRRPVPLRLGLAVAVLGAALACVPGPTAIDLAAGQLQVHAAFVEGADDVLVVVGRMDPDVAELRGVTDAEVRLSRGAESWTLPHRSEKGASTGGCLPTGSRSAEGGCYQATIPGGVVAGDSFHLEIATPAGEAVTGGVRVPRPLDITAPTDHVVIDLDCAEEDPDCDGGGNEILVGALTIHWDADPAIGRVEAYTPSATGYRDGQPLTGAECYVRSLGENARAAAVDSVVLGIDEARCVVDSEYVAWDSIAVTARVAAYDTAFARYYRSATRDLATADELSAGLDGALGYVAGVTRTAVSFSVRRE